MNLPASVCNKDALRDNENILFYPSEQFGPDTAGFLSACEAAQATGTELRIQADIKLNETIKIKKFLHISGPFGLDFLPIVSSSMHSVFVCSGKGTLTLNRVCVKHVQQSPNKEQLGACVLVRNNAKCMMKGCVLRSDEGFAIWILQDACVSMQDSSVTAKKRSGCVIFGAATLNASNCTIFKCGMHGICLRGSAMLRLSECLIRDCERRGVYSYGQTKVVLLKCVFEGILDSTCGAVEYRPRLTAGDAKFESGGGQHQWHSAQNAFEIDKHSSYDVIAGLHVEECIFRRNLGCGMLLRIPPVAVTAMAQHLQLDASIFSENSCGNCIQVWDEQSYNKGLQSGEEDTAENSEGLHAKAVDASHAVAECAELPQGTWQFERDSIGEGGGSDWREYDMVSQHLLEEAWKAHLSALVDSGASLPVVASASSYICHLGAYEVDVASMTQWNTRTTFQRSVRRLPPTKAASPMGVLVRHELVPPLDRACVLPELS